jgi:hypothetical protein
LRLSVFGVFLSFGIIAPARAGPTGSAEARLPTNRGFDEWYGIPRTYDEAEWPSLNETNSMWPSVGNIQGPTYVLATPVLGGQASISLFNGAGKRHCALWPDNLPIAGPAGRPVN